MFMPGALASLIESHWRIYILLIFLIRFNISIIYAILYGYPTYGDNYIFPYLDYWIGDYVQLLMYIFFIYFYFYLTLVLPQLPYICAVLFYLIAHYIILSHVLYICAVYGSRTCFYI